MRMLFFRAGGRHHQKPARHPQMHHQRIPAVQPDQQVFAPPPQFVHAPAGDALRKYLRPRLRDYLRPVENQSGQTAAAELRLQHLSYHFHFRQLRHVRSPFCVLRRYDSF